MTYRLTVCQQALRRVFEGDAPFDRSALDFNIDHASAMVRAAVREHGSRLVLLPEFCLHGITPGRSVADWVAASIRMPGPETDRLSVVAVETGAYVGGCSFEFIPEFPGRYWNTAFLIAPSGDIVLKHRKLYAMTSKTRPSDVYSEWVQRYGPESLFPVVDTPLGRLGFLIARETHWPEMARALALRGAEVFLNTMGSRIVLDPATGGHVVRQVRAYENIAYLAAANYGPFLGVSGSAGVPRMYAEVVDYEGRVIARAVTYDETMVTAEIDLQALRRRRTGQTNNLLAQLQPQLHATAYAAADFFPLDHWRDRPAAHEAENTALERAIIDRLVASGVLIAPE